MNTYKEAIKIQGTLVLKISAKFLWWEKNAYIVCPFIKTTFSFKWGIVLWVYLWRLTWNFAFLERNFGIIGYIGLGFVSAYNFKGGNNFNLWSFSFCGHIYDCYNFKSEIMWLCHDSIGLNKFIYWFGLVLKYNFKVCPLSVFVFGFMWKPYHMSIQTLLSILDTTKKIVLLRRVV